jgi:acetoin utilization deacetylase AcuC-like enzyme
MKIPVLFHERQLDHRPLYEWAFGNKLAHPETSRRADNIHAALRADAATFSISPPAAFPVSLIEGVHDGRLISLYKTAAAKLTAGETHYPSVFPRRSQTTGDPNDIHKAGYFCFDSGTPLTPETWEAAAWSAACADEASRIVEAGSSPLAYALCRPPGHHASRDLFGGYCYFNNAAIVARRLRDRGRIVILDIDFHHGNGTQDIFYRDDQVLFISIHGSPDDFYPYFSGFAAETGAGKGQGFNLNIPLPRGTDGQEYRRMLEGRVLPAIRAFGPSYQIISAGFDTFKNDPIGAFTLETADYDLVGDLIGRTGVPTLVLQEGGYCVEDLGLNVVSFLRGVRAGLSGAGVGLRGRLSAAARSGSRPPRGRWGGTGPGRGRPRGRPRGCWRRGPRSSSGRRRWRRGRSRCPRGGGGRG